MTAKRQSIEPTYDSERDGPQFHVTTMVGGRVVGEFRQPIPDPFVYHTVHVCLRDLLLALRHPRRGLKVEVIVGATPQLLDDVLELDAQTLIGNSTRRDEFEVSLGASLHAFAQNEPPEGGE